MTESLIVDLLLIPFIGLLILDFYFWFWKTKGSSFAPLTLLISITISANEIDWPLWLRLVFPLAVFIANSSFSILVNRKGWRGILARGRGHDQTT